MTFDSRWIVLASLGLALLGLGAPWGRTFADGSVTALSTGGAGRLLIAVFLIGAAGIVVSLATRYRYGGFWVALAAAVVGCVVSTMYLVESPPELGPLITLVGAGNAIAFGLIETRGWRTLKSERTERPVALCGTLLVVAAAVVVAGGVLPLFDGLTSGDAAITSLTWWPSGLLAFGALICGALARSGDLDDARRWRFLLLGSLALIGGGTFSWYFLDIWQQLGLGLDLVSYGIALPAVAVLVAPVLGLAASDEFEADSFNVSLPIEPSSG